MAEDTTITTSKSPIRCEFRHQVNQNDRENVRRIITSSGYFRPNEVDVAIELVDDYLTRGERCGYKFLFAESRSQTIGYTCYGPTPCTDSGYDLYWIAVDEKFRDHGIGKQLLKKTEQIICSLGGTKVYAETSGRDQYASTRAFYSKCGYTTVAIIKDFYSVGDDKHIFCKNVR